MIFRFLLLSLISAVGYDVHAPEAMESTSIDSLLAQRYTANNIEPLPACDDLQFLRRASLDLIGRVPTLDEIGVFQKNPDRMELVERLIDSPQFDRFLSETWTAWLIGYSNAFGTDREVFRIWLEEQIRDQVSFKSIVEQMITARGSIAIDGPSNYLVRHRAAPAINISRSFLGVRLECAQCHDHPFDRWTQEDYQRMSRFFGLMRVEQRERTAIIRDIIQSPGNENQRPKFLTGSIPRTGKFRDELALYVTHCNPFARTFANRVWYQLIGRGIIDPPDDHNQENPPADQQLLDFLAGSAKEDGFQIKPFFKMICSSQAYQRECAMRDTAKEATLLFAARQVKPMLAEQYVDSFSVITNRTLEPAERRAAIARLVGQTRIYEDFQRTWDYLETNQQLIEKFAASLPIDDQEASFSLDELYLKILTRYPSKRERELCRDKSRVDITFALLFGNEFFFNH